MIVGSDKEHKIGQKVLADYFRDGVLHPEHPFVVVREATMEEFVAERGLAATDDVTQERARAMGSHVHPSPIRLRFYEVSTD